MTVLSPAPGHLASLGTRPDEEDENAARDPMHADARWDLEGAHISSLTTCRPIERRASAFCCRSWAHPMRGRWTGSAVRIR